MPPIYESDEDRARQACVKWVLEFCGYTVTETSTLAPYDFMLHRNGRRHAIVEYKFREKQYSDLRIDKEKIDTLIDIASRHSLKPILLIDWADVGLYFWLCREGCEVHTMLRTKSRGIKGETKEAPDIVYAIPISEFRSL